MIFTHFLQIFLRQWFLIVAGLICQSMQTLKKLEKALFLKPNTVYNANFSVETCLEHGFAIEYTYFQ